MFLHTNNKKYLRAKLQEVCKILIADFLKWTRCDTFSGSRNTITKKIYDHQLLAMNLDWTEHCPAHIIHNYKQLTVKCDLNASALKSYGSLPKGQILKWRTVPLRGQNSILYLDWRHETPHLLHGWTSKVPFPGQVFLNLCCQVFFQLWKKDGVNKDGDLNKHFICLGSQVQFYSLAGHALFKLYWLVWCFVAYSIYYIKWILIMIVVVFQALKGT